MNKTFKVIRNRRSIRNFMDEQIKKEELDAILEAGLYAPSGMNSQDWHFTVIQNRKMIDIVNEWILLEVKKINDSRLNDAVAQGKFFRNAPTVIIVSSDSKDPFGIVNAAAATENIMLAAESLGMGSCWIGFARYLSTSECFSEYAKQLHIPNGYAISNGITLGYKATETPPAPERKKDLVSYIL